MTRRALTSLLFAVCLALSPVWAQDSGDELRTLQGVWTVAAAEQRGRPFDVIVGGTLTVTDQRFVLQTATGNTFKGEIRIDASTSPRQLDFIHSDGIV